MRAPLTFVPVLVPIVHLLVVTTADAAYQYSNYLPEKCIRKFKHDMEDVRPHMWYDVSKAVKIYREFTECTRDERHTPMCTCAEFYEEPSKESLKKPFKDCLFDYPHSMLTCPFFVVPFLITVVSVLWMFRMIESKTKKPSQSP
ncbi:receptor activity-modifying protein 1-like [Rhynchocyon petersi]